VSGIRIKSGVYDGLRPDLFPWTGTLRKLASTGAHILTQRSVELHLGLTLVRSLPDEDGNVVEYFAVAHGGSLVPVADVLAKADLLGISPVEVAASWPSL
jgi:hypothetical protein